ncbi:E3 ubiquitin-protein ligase [Forsythia ovata]|uniref:E3 ubiquitin-protein ligase n=1 Tax=Forsythia ovata TaxID=205694 RepID=A0ABD1PKF6_9LAMI
MPTLIQENHLRQRTFLTENQRKLLFLLFKCIIMALVVALFLFFIGFATIVLLHFLMMTNAFRRRIRINPFLFSGSVATTSAATTTTPNLRELQDILPKVEYSASAFPRNTDCAICLESFVEGDECKSLPTCQHIFHANCVDQWLGRKLNCPTCRTRVDINPAKRGSRISTADRWKMLWQVEFEEGNSRSPILSSKDVDEFIHLTTPKSWLLGKEFVGYKIKRAAACIGQEMLSTKINNLDPISMEQHLLDFTFKF